MNGRRTDAGSPDAASEKSVYKKGQGIPIEQEQRIRALVRVARTWRDPAYPRRKKAVEQTLEKANRFTPEAVAFAINQQMHQVTPKALRAWLGAKQAQTVSRVGVRETGMVPMDAFRDVLAVVLVGHHLLGMRPSASPFLVPAFVRDLQQHLPQLEASFSDADDAFEAVDAVIATDSEETEPSTRALCERFGIREERRLIRHQTFAVAVIDGHESEAERDGLAEDALLHEGLSGRNVALIWAPKGMSPDSYLESFAGFRGVFPAHPDTPGALRMQQAFLAAVDQPHAYGDGLEFLVSKGPVERQSPGHIRWVEYESLEDVATWLVAERSAYAFVVARSSLGARVGELAPVVAPGNAHRPRVTAASETIDFLCSL